MAKEKKTAPADEAPLTDDQKRSLIRDHLLEITRLGVDLIPETPNAFDAIQPKQPTGDMRTVRDSAGVKRALVGIDAAVREATGAETVVAAAMYIAGRLGVSLVS